jgi:hypothetical protein
MAPKTVALSDGAKVVLLRAGAELAKREKRAVVVSVLVRQLVVDGCWAILRAAGPKSESGETEPRRDLRWTSAQILERRVLGNPAVEAHSLRHLEKELLEGRGAVVPGSVSLRAEERQRLEDAALASGIVPVAYAQLVERLIAEGADAILSGLRRPGVHGQKVSGSGRLGVRIKAPAVAVEERVAVERAAVLRVWSTEIAKAEGLLVEAQLKERMALRRAKAVEQQVYGRAGKATSAEGRARVKVAEVALESARRKVRSAERAVAEGRRMERLARAR